MRQSVRYTGLAGAMVGALAVLATPAMAEESPQAQIVSLSEDGQAPSKAIATAHQQEAAGNSLEAASTLERALIEHADADNVRLAYVAVLCRLGDTQSARIELAALRGRPTGKPEWNEMTEACGTGFAGTTHHQGRINGSVSVGLGYDDDAYGNLLGGFTSYGPPSRDGLGLISAGNLNARLDTGASFLYGTLNAQSHDDLSGPTNDFQYAEVRAGFGREGESNRIKIGAVYRYGRVNGASYLNEYGGQLRLDHRVGSHSWISLFGETTRQEFEIPYYNLDGLHYEAGLAFEAHPAPDKAFLLSAAGEIKDAPYYLDRYHAIRLRAALRLPANENGTYVSLSTTARHISYFGDQYSSGEKDWRIYTRAALGTPIWHNLIGEAAVTYSVRTYNQFYKDTYQSVGGQLRLIYRF